MLIHDTQNAFMRSSGGIKGRGLVPGGISGKSERDHLYVSTAIPDKDGTLPNKYKRRGTDCMVYLDPALMKTNYDLAMSANGTIMIGERFKPEHILRVTMLGTTAYTLYSRPQGSTVGWRYADRLRVLHLQRPLPKRHQLVLRQLLDAYHVGRSP